MKSPADRRSFFGPAAGASAAATSVRQTADRAGIRWREMRTLRAALFKHGFDIRQPIQGVSETVRRWAIETFHFGSLRLLDRRDSQVDGATKLLFERTDGDAARFETVILRYPHGRTSLCVSSQAGCALRCRFCATGQLTRAIDLTVEEILEQVVVALRVLHVEGRGGSLRNIVFMGMGEPLQNRQGVDGAIDALVDGERFNIPSRSILLSTVGLTREIESFRQRHPGVRLAVSLHAARQEVRERLMPISRKYTVEELATVLSKEFPTGGAESVMLEVLLLEELTDRDEDCAALVEFARRMSAHVNLIPFNPSGLAERMSADVTDPLALIPSSDERFRHFRAALNAAGIPVTRRHSLGSDIEAACGQLALTRRSN